MSNCAGYCADTPPRILQDFTMKQFKAFSGECVVHEDIIESFMLACDVFWEHSVKTWERYACHGGRQHLEKSDLQLHMLRIDLIKDYNEFRALVNEHLSSADAYEVLNSAQPKTISSHKPSKKHYRSKMFNNSISALQAYARRTLFSCSFKKSKIPNKAKKQSDSITELYYSDAEDGRNG